MLAGKSFRALAHKINVRTLTQNLARCPHRIAQVLHASHASRAKRGSIHDQRIHLHAPIAIQKAATPGVESLVIFHDDDGLLNGIESRAAALEHAPSRGQRVVHATKMGVDHVIRHGPGPAMNHQNRISRQENPRIPQESATG